VAIIDGSAITSADVTAGGSATLRGGTEPERDSEQKDADGDETECGADSEGSDDEQRQLDEEEQRQLQMEVAARALRKQKANDAQATWMRYTTKPHMYPRWSGDGVSPTGLIPTRPWRQLVTRIHQDGSGPFTSYALPEAAKEHISLHQGRRSLGWFPGEIPPCQQLQLTDHEAYEQYCRRCGGDQAVQDSDTAHPTEDLQTFVRNRPVRILLEALSVSYVELCRSGQLGSGGHLSPRPQVEVRSRDGSWYVCARDVPLSCGANLWASRVLCRCRRRRHI